MYNEFIEQLKKYLDLGEELAVAQVISRQTPSSGKPGDKAIILKDGTLIGWIGGGCVKGIAIKEGIDAIKDKKSRLVKISPENGNSQDEEHKTYQMTCHSGGTMELFIEPVIPNPHIVIVGKSNIARALAKIANAANQRVTVLAKAADKAMFPDVKLVDSNSDFSNVLIDNNTFIIVSTQGENDEEAIKSALLTSCNYVGFISSKRKSDKVKEYLKMDGLKSARLKELKTPVGIDINAKLPEEIAISILADVITNFRRQLVPKDTLESKGIEDGYKEQIMGDNCYINPVCDIPVSISEAKHTVEYKGHTVYFCCDGCKISFDKEPDKYIKILEKREK